MTKAPAKTPRPRDARKAKREQRALPKEQRIEDLRDDVMSVVRNSGLSYQEIAARGGPSYATLANWQHKEVKRPQLNTIRGALKACGHDLFILPKGTAYVRPSKIR